MHMMFCLYPFNDRSSHLYVLHSCYLAGFRRPLWRQPSYLYISQSSDNPVDGVISQRPVPLIFYPTPSPAIRQLIVSNQGCIGNLVFAPKVVTITVIVHSNHELSRASIPAQVWPTTIATIAQTIPTIFITN